MRIRVMIEVRKAEPATVDGLFYVEFGPNTFTHSPERTFTSYAELRAELERIAAELAADPNLAGWPAVCVSARVHPTERRNPNGWSSNHESRQAFARVQAAAGQA